MSQFHSFFEVCLTLFSRREEDFGVWNKCCLTFFNFISVLLNNLILIFLSIALNTSLKISSPNYSVLTQVLLSKQIFRESADLMLYCPWHPCPLLLPDGLIFQLSESKFCNNSNLWNEFFDLISFMNSSGGLTGFIFSKIYKMNEQYILPPTSLSRL